MSSSRSGHLSRPSAASGRWVGGADDTRQAPEQEPATSTHRQGGTRVA
ncbi:MAG: hypothetical protein R3C11_24550 [Planctomycetaceae bacterium]